jgi:hypothetical protein
LLLPLATLLVVAPRDRRQHVQQHVVDRAEHAGVELVLRRRQVLPGRRHVDRHHAHLALADRALELFPLDAGQPRETVHVLHQQHVGRPAVGQQPEQLGPVQPRTGLVLRVVVADHHAALVRKAGEGAAGALRVLLVGGGAQVGADEELHRY